jgi:UPF0755 protein
MPENAPAGFMKAALALFLIGAGILTSFLAANTYTFLFSPSQTPGQEVILGIPPGASFDSIVRRLKQKEVISNTKAFRLLGTISGKVRKIRAGEFRLHTSMAPLEVLRHLTKGRSVLHRLQIREGLPWWEVGRIVEQAGLGSFETFKAAVHDPELLSRYGIQAPNAEGYLFPETYYLPRPRQNNATQAVATMLKMFCTKAAEIWPKELPAPEQLHRTVILASLVEKETAVPSERARVAGVYANRLHKGMRLQCDPTIIYGLGLAFNGNLTRKHIRNKNNRYNTYQHAGLPPGPICSPGMDALLAARTPKRHSDLYFVARKDGTHHFSKTLKEHNKAVRTYQLGR